MRPSQPCCKGMLKRHRFPKAPPPPSRAARANLPPSLIDIKKTPFPTHPLPPFPSRPALYRAYLQHLRLIPDPHVWTVFLPRIRKLCRKPAETASRPSVEEWEAMSPEDRERWRAEKGGDEKRRLESLKEGRKELQLLRAAVACHPNALVRYLQEAYGQRHKPRWTLINRITRSSPPAPPHAIVDSRPDLPAPLQPLRPKPLTPTEKSPRAKAPWQPALFSKTKQAAVYKRDWEDCGVPIVLPRIPSALQPPPSAEVLEKQAGTSWEGRGLPESLRILSRLEDRVLASEELPRPPRRGRDETSPEVERGLMSARELPSFQFLPKHIQRLFPCGGLQVRLRHHPLNRPQQGSMRENPNRWRDSVPLTPRLLYRAYRRMFEGLPWVRPKPSTLGGAVEDVQWVRCTWEEMRDFEEGREQVSDAATYTPGKLDVLARQAEERWDHEVQEVERIHHAEKLAALGEEGKKGKGRSKKGGLRRGGMEKAQKPVDGVDRGEEERGESGAERNEWRWTAANAEERRWIEGGV